jgi:hypothetical protein
MDQIFILFENVAEIVAAKSMSYILVILVSIKHFHKTAGFIVKTSCFTTKQKYVTEL